jgi:hypothetical protein
MFPERSPTPVEIEEIFVKIVDTLLKSVDTFPERSPVTVEIEEIFALFVEK